MKFVTIIPARSGSVNLKNKNILKFNAKPLIYWSIKAAKDSKIVKDVFVSTNSTKIAKISKKYGCKVPFLRKKDLASSNSIMKDVIVDTLNNLNAFKEKKYDAVILLQPTSPLRSGKDIDKACNIFIKKKPDSLVSVCKLHHCFNPEQLYIQKKGYLKKISRKKTIELRQKKKKYYAHNGAAIYITNIKKIKKFIIGGKIASYQMEKYYSYDIDDKEDFKIAELIHKNLKKLK